MSGLFRLSRKSSVKKEQGGLNTPPPPPRSSVGTDGVECITEDVARVSFACQVTDPTTQKLFDQLSGMLDAIKAINQETEPAKAINIFIEEATKLLKCDRATVFMVDAFTNELVIKVASGDVDIRIPTTAGIAGHVYTTGEILNIPDAYEDPRFNKTTDTKTGYRTKSLLCLPVKDSNGVTVAVLQAINKLPSGNAFDDDDVKLVDHMASQVGIVLRNIQLFEAARVAKAKVDAMLDIVRSLHGDLGINSLLFTMTERTPLLVDADRCTMFLIDRMHNELTSMHGAMEIRIPLNRGLAGLVATSGKVVNIPDAYQDSRFNQEIDKSSGYRTKSILTMPVRSTAGSVIAVIQLINKAQGVSFTTDDEQLLESFLGIAGSMLQTSQMFNESRVKLNEMEKLAEVKVTKSKGLSSMATFDEQDEDEDEES